MTTNVGFGLNVQSFFEKLAAANQKKKNHICVGIDPHTSKLPPFFKRELAKSPFTYLKNFSKAVIDASKDAASVVKFQSAHFEVHGDKGVLALKTAISYAKEKKLLTILDAKRGDIKETMSAYADAAFSYFKADSMTVLPYMGIGTFEPLLPWFAKGKGAYMVWMSSNPEANALQERITDFLLKDLTRWAENRGVVNAFGLVAGATKLEMLAPDQMKDASRFALLLPGIGAQGGTLNDSLREVFRLSPSSVFNSSRAITGLGLDGENQLGTIKSWSAYREYVREKIDLFQVY